MSAEHEKLPVAWRSSDSPRCKCGQWWNQWNDRCTAEGSGER